MTVLTLEENRARRDAAIRDKRSVATHLPSELTVAATDRCNLRCVMCGTHHPQEGARNAGCSDFPAHLIRKLEGMTAGAERIQVHGGGGEPMMSRTFWDWVALFAGNKSAQIEFNTNGLFLSPPNIERLMQQRVGFISVSLDAASPEVYRKIRGGDWTHLMRNVEALSKARRESRPEMRLALNMTVMRENAREMPGLVRLAHELAIDEVQFYKLNAGPQYSWKERTRDGYSFDYRENLPENNVTHIRPFLEEAISLAPQLGIRLEVDPRLHGVVAPAAPPPDHSPSTVQYSHCSAPWRWLSVTARGDVFPCCHAVAPLGNLEEAESLREIWNGPALRRLRTNVANNQIDPICKGASCIYVMPQT